MKVCNYCGGENQNTAAYCAGCGCRDFKSTAPDAPATKTEESAKPVAPLPETPELTIGVDKGPKVTRITCRTSQEADLVLNELESADIIGFVPDERPNEACVIHVGDNPVQVVASTKAYENAQEIHSAVDPDIIAKTPLPWITRYFIMFLTVFTIFGVWMLILLLAHYRHHGQQVRIREARRWFARGVAFWVLAAGLATVVFLVGTKQ